MKKRWRIAILTAVALALAVFAGAAWLGFLPFGRPDNEHDFMAEQLNRVRYAGPFRSDEDRALADLLPPDPSIDDMRVAYWKRLSALDAVMRQSLLDARPELRQFKFPAHDEAARKALDALNERASRIEVEHPHEGWVIVGGDGGTPDRRAAFLDSTADMPDQLAAAVPASGMVLLRFIVDGEPDLPASFGAAVRVMTVRVRCLYASGDIERGWQELLQLAQFCRDADYGPFLTGRLCYELKNSTFLLKCVLPLASDGRLPATQLEELAASHQLKMANALEVARAEGAYSLVARPDASALDVASQVMVAKTWTEAAFERHGATTIGRWLESEVEHSRLRHQGWDDRLDGLARRGGNFRDPNLAAALLDNGDRDKGDWVLDQTKVLATAASSTAESEGLLLAVKLFALKARDPAGWHEQVAKLAAGYPFARLEWVGSGVEVRPNLSHPALAYLKEPDRVYATVE